MDIYKEFNEVREQARIIRESVPESDLRRNYSSMKFAHGLFTAGSFGMLLLFFIFWWAGSGIDEILSEMGIAVSMKMAMVLGGVLSAAIASGQYSLYQHPIMFKTIMHAKIAVIILCVVADIGVNMDREAERVNDLSLDSPALKAAVSQANRPISAGSTSMPPAYNQAVTEKQDAMLWVNGKCETTHGAKGQERIDKCITYEQARLDAAKATISDFSRHSTQMAQAAATVSISAQRQQIETIKNLSQDEETHSHPLVKLINYITSFDFIFSSMIVSLIVMIPIELMFIATGRSCLQYQMALGGSLGNKKDRADTQHTEQHSDNADRQYNEVPESELQKTALNLIWNAIDSSKISSLSKRDDGQIHTLLKERGFESTNERRRKLVYWVIQALETEKVIITRPPDVPGKTDFIINPDRKIRYNPAMA